MDTPDNLRRLAESEALVESLQTMEYLTEFPTLEERRDFRRFPPRYGDPHYHPSRLKKNGDGRPRRREEERIPAIGSFSDRETRRNVFGRGGFMSPMRRIAEVARRVPEVQDITISDSPGDLTDVNIMGQETERQNPRLESNPTIEENILPTVEQQTSVRDDTIREPRMVEEHIPLTNGAPPTSREEQVTTTINTATTSTFVPTVTTVPRESTSLPSTPQVSSTGIEEGISPHGPICLPEEDPHIICSICNIADCMINNPRHQYCIDCGQRLLGPHVCPNETEHSDPTRTQTSTMIRRTQPIPLDDGRIDFSGTFFVLHAMSHHTLPTYDEAILSHQGVTARARMVPDIHNVLHHIDYSSDPEEVRIHFELTPPSRYVRSCGQHRSPRRLRRTSPDHLGVSHHHHYHGNINVRQPPWTTDNITSYKTHTKLRQTSGGDDGSSPGDEGDSASGRDPDG